MPVSPSHTAHPSVPSPVRDRIAGAPISWGVCEVPGWGYQLDAPTVLEQMRDLGLAATEFGPVGFLGSTSEDLAARLSAHGMTAVGGFLPVLLHDPGHDPLLEVDRFIDDCLATGAGVVVLAAFTGVEGYDDRPVLDDTGWQALLDNLDRATDLAANRGVVAALHPHVGTMVETGEETERVLAGSRVGLCVDTGHLLVGGADPVALTAAHPERVVHVHLKDVDGELAERVIAGETSFGDAVRDGLFVPLGEGSVDVATLVRTLEGAGYGGWYVLEQDVKLAGRPEGEGPVADVRRCLDYLEDAVR
ncbi:TIM barrel protein [Nocardioides sp. HDW12B]|uniref:TIM barrel protein n=1 Tax=Nocardioides sp. HDW12B TaxID=2714939 RepID=UPI00140D0250|nr:TIM barrel protein [Nocardioides sp. HDW12B]QIK66670.1 TIM barrel protein [Nocardioides sp. HDW12B]